MRSVDVGIEPPVVGYVLCFPKVARNSHVNLSNVEIGSLELQRLWGVLESSGTRIACDFWLTSGMAALLSRGSCHGLAEAGQVGGGFASQTPSLVGVGFSAALWCSQKCSAPTCRGAYLPMTPRCRGATRPSPSDAM